MTDLLKSFDTYNDFVRGLYFTLIYEEIASSVMHETPLPSSKENREAVEKVLNLQNGEFELVFNNWNTEDSVDADFSQDYPYESAYRCISQKYLIYIRMEEDSLLVDFLFDGKDKALEQRVMEQNHALRKSFGLERAPAFKVLTKSNIQFHTEDVRTKLINLDLNFYNDDFIPVHEEIEKAMSEQRSGLVLLYGKPGTGKTSYIKSLIGSFPQLNFIFVQNEFVNNLLDPDFITFLLRQRNAVLVIEDAEKVLKNRDKVNEDSVVSTVLQLTDGLFSDYLNIKVICTFNTSLASIDQALLRKGRMIGKYEFGDLSLEKTNQLLKERDLPKVEEGLSLANIFGFDQKSFDTQKKRRIGF
ncbi:AAA family ATPase [Persicobacter diffluens]|uniref:ATPase AAA-type core domain-containing protein n=1 Tax=Persicobacter diffluens TaxID=981 RepID=A0AAN5AKU0_9BACT|nr:hypothetical protein PEDI_30660 [Persicobacter diffluens]